MRSVKLVAALDNLKLGRSSLVFQMRPISNAGCGHLPEPALEFLLSHRQGLAPLTLMRVAEANAKASAKTSYFDE